ncbi:MAG: hypothetical protein EXS13_04640 [Planctomycetes bacterium]|nr:hypothetical protein [Planctomycetota bacterium]
MSDRRDELTGNQAAGVTAPDAARMVAQRAADAALFLPDDSFLLDLDDAALTPLPTAENSLGDEFLLVEDDFALDAVASAGAFAEPIAEPIEETAAASPVAPRLPSWLTPDESEVAAFANDEDEVDAEADAALAAAASDLAPVAAQSDDGLPEVDAAGPIESSPDASSGAPLSLVEAAVAAEPPLAPILPIRRSRRVVAAAGMLVAGALTAALLFELDRRGAVDLGRGADPATVAVAPRVPLRPIEVNTPVAGSEAASAVVPVVVPLVMPATTELAAAPPAEVTVDPVAAPTEASAVALPEPVVVKLPEKLPVDLPVERAAQLPTELPARPELAPPLVVVETAPRQRLPPIAAPRAPRSALEGSETIVQLGNGHLFRGRIARVRDTKLTLKIGAGECAFDLSEISLLDSTEPEFRREEDMPEASVVLRNGQRLRGRLMKQTTESVVLVVANGQVVCPRADVREVSFTGRIHF